MAWNGKCWFCHWSTEMSWAGPCPRCLHCGEFTDPATGGPFTGTLGPVVEVRLMGNSAPALMTGVVTGTIEEGNQVETIYAYAASGPSTRPATQEQIDQGHA